jgi:hypothetical protein
MSEEIIRIKEERPVTKVVYFTNVIIRNNQLFNLGITPRNNWDLIIDNGIEAYGLIGPANKIIELIENVDGAFCKRIPLTSEYRFLTEEESKSVVKGLYFENKFESILEPETIQNIYNNFELEAQAASGSTAYTFIDIKEDSLEDYNVDICFKRSVDTLDTLTVRNNPLSNFPTQESDTGVVMGTLYAKQKVVNEKGEKVLIPLSNVPIVIFNPSDEFPNTFSIDGDGNRVRLNLIQNSELEDYVDLDSFVVEYGKQNAEKKLNKTLNPRFDSQIGTLKSIETLEVPEYFKYSTITNENGEFIIENVPIGPNVLMFEVDLLKQGMTRSEVALNFFPYPTTEEFNVDSIPHYYFRQLSINVIPSWGAFQTGYTFVDITANIDMRKWSTFFIPPIAVQGKSIDELISSGRFDALTIIAKDMTKEGYPISNQIVEINNILEREPSQRLEWNNEFTVRKNKIEFRKSNYNAFKLPANLYDPNGNASKDGGRTKISTKKGVWLCAYQMRMQYGLGTGVLRETGFVRESFLNDTPYSSHFNVNRGVGSSSTSVLVGIGLNGSLGEFPYQRTWTINYPEPYKIPTRPLILNESKNFTQKVEPRYLDGDLAGEFTWQDEARGYGLMSPLQSGDLIYNQFAQTVTKSRIYKYESNVNWHEEYSNGYRKSEHENLFPNKKFEVKNGEKYQRVEAGFGYFLKPEGWGRINQETWGDYMVGSDIGGGETAPSNFFPPKYNSSMYRDGEVLYFRFDTGISPKWLKNGSLDIYRIIDDTPEDLSPLIPPLTQKACIIDIRACLRNAKKDSRKLKLETGSSSNYRRVFYCNDTKVEITNVGVRKSSVTVNGVKKSILSEQSETFDLGNSGTIKLETNKDLNFEENFYQNASYRLRFFTNEIQNSPEVSFYLEFGREGGDFNNPNKFFLVADIFNARYKINNKGECKDNPYRVGNYKMNGLILHRTSSSINYRFRTALAETTCDNDLGVGFLRTDI